jgi:hypothetical protein
MNPWTLYLSFITTPLSSIYLLGGGKRTKHEIERVLCLIIGIRAELDGLHVVDILLEHLKAMLLLHGLVDGPDEAILKGFHAHTTQA